MPTYDWKCAHCESACSQFMSIHEYVRDPNPPTCMGHGPMERKLSVNPAMSGTANILAGDRHYDGLRAQDGTDISSRTKHREYMKRTGLTMADDFKSTFAQKQGERELHRAAQHKDPELRQEVEKQVMTAVAKSD